MAAVVVFLMIFLPALVLLFVPVSLLPTMVARVAVRAVMMAFHTFDRKPGFLLFVSLAAFSASFCAAFVNGFWSCDP